MATEHEVKLAVWPGFVLPPLDGIGGSVTTADRGEHRQEAVYYDTTDVRLARSGITLRHRSDDGWTLKLPSDAPANGVLRREELVVPGDPRSIPAPLLDRVASRVRTEALVPVARLHTVRHRTDVLADDGGIVAQVLDDEVSVLEGRRVALRFRELEVELVDAEAEHVLDEIVAALHVAGAGDPDPTPKVMRALGPRARVAPELAPRGLSSQPTAEEVLTVGLLRSVRQLVEQDPVVRADDDGGDGVEGVHQARVAVRRLRSDLRTYGSLVDPAWAGELRTELKWVADAFGAVRDADVLLPRLARQLDELRRPDRLVGTRLLDRLAEEREAHRVALLEVMRSDRYLALLDHLVAGATKPRTLPAAAAPASKVLPRLAAGPWAALEKAAKRVSGGSADDELHEVRVRAKRARYAADVAAIVVGSPARRFASALAGVQDVLGEHQDACVARDWLRHQVADLDGPTGFVAGQLASCQDQEAAERRAEWPETWRRANRGKLRAWLH